MANSRVLARRAEKPPSNSLREKNEDMLGAAALESWRSMIAGGNQSFHNDVRLFGFQTDMDGAFGPGWSRTHIGIQQANRRRVLFAPVVHRKQFNPILIAPERQ